MKSNKQDIQKLRLFYLNNPPDSLSKKQILNMSDNDLLDMVFFLNEDINEIFELDDDDDALM